LCEYLLENNAKINKADSFCMTALHWACSLGLTNIVKILFNYDVNPHLLDVKNQTPLDKAINNSNREIVFLFTRRFSLQHKYREYLLSAIKMSDYEVFKYDAL
jgi:ankyrin repeat protein